MRKTEDYGEGEGEKNRGRIERMTFDPGGPDGSGPPLQKEEGDVRSTKEYIISSSSACGLHKVRANCEGSSQVFTRARASPSRLTPVSETRVASSGTKKKFEASDSRCLTADDPFYRDVVPPAAGGNLFTTESLLLSPRHLLLLLLLLPPPATLLFLLFFYLYHRFLSP